MSNGVADAQHRAAVRKILKLGVISRYHAGNLDAAL